MISNNNLIKYFVLILFVSSLHVSWSWKIQSPFIRNNRQSLLSLNAKRRTNLSKNKPSSIESDASIPIFEESTIAKSTNFDGNQFDQIKVTKSLSQEKTGNDGSLSAELQEDISEFQRFSSNFINEQQGNKPESGGAVSTVKEIISYVLIAGKLFENA
jgi:hypothetical protein